MEEFRISRQGTKQIDVFRTGKLLCIGRNYAKHAAELGNKVPSSPMVFLKPSSSIIRSGGTVRIPEMSNDVHHEVELVCAIGKKGSNISASEALSFVAGYAVGLDMTARDIQQKAKEKGHPWSVAKGFDTFAPLGDFVAAEEILDPQNLPICLRVNGEIRQEGNTSDMIFSVAQLITYCSTIFTLMPGDLLFTGTPDGVGPVKSGETMIATIEGLSELAVNVE